MENAKLQLRLYSDVNQLICAFSDNGKQTFLLSEIIDEL